MREAVRAGITRKIGARGPWVGPTNYERGTTNYEYWSNYEFGNTGAVILNEVNGSKKRKRGQEKAATQLVAA